MAMRGCFFLALLLLTLAAPRVRADEANAPAPGTTEIRLTQQATRTMAPDRLRAELRVEAKGSDARLIQAEINRHMQAALAKAKAHPDVTAETGSYSVSHDFSVQNRQVWQGDQTLILTSPDFSGLLALAGEMQGDGLLVSGMNFFLAHETLAAAQSELTSSALAGLKARAEEVAKDLGLRLDRFKDITVGNANANTNPVPLMRMQAMAPAAMPPPVAQAGDATVSLSVEGVAVLVSAKP
jgi:predicted secreted protein